MNIYSKSGCIFMVQIDHASGELLGPLFERLYQAGAYNVQCCPGMTKKNRPSYLLFIDSSLSSQADIEAVIVQDIGSTGWHQWETNHRHIPHRSIQRKITVSLQGQRFDFLAEVKVSQQPYDLIRPELDNVICLQDTIMQQAQIYLPIRYLEMRLRLNWERQEAVLDLDQGTSYDTASS